MVEGSPRSLDGRRQRGVSSEPGGAGRKFSFDEETGREYLLFFVRPEEGRFCQARKGKAGESTQDEEADADYLFLETQRGVDFVRQGRAGLEREHSVLRKLGTNLFSLRLKEDQF